MRLTASCIRVPLQSVLVSRNQQTIRLSACALTVMVDVLVVVVVDMTAIVEERLLSCSAPEVKVRWLRARPHADA